MIEFKHFSVNLDATPKPTGGVVLPKELAHQMVNDMCRMLLAHDDGSAFGVDVSFAQGRPAQIAVQRIGATACAAEWSRHEQVLAVTLILSGLDAKDDDLAIQTVVGGWGLALGDEYWNAIRAYERPVIVSVFAAPGSSSDVVIQGGIACLGSAFGLLLGSGDEKAQVE